MSCDTLRTSFDHSVIQREEEINCGLLALAVRKHLGKSVETGYALLALTAQKHLLKAAEIACRIANPLGVEIDGILAEADEMMSVNNADLDFCNLPFQGQFWPIF